MDPCCPFVSGQTQRSCPFPAPSDRISFLLCNSAPFLQRGKNKKHKCSMCGVSEFPQPPSNLIFQGTDKGVPLFPLWLDSPVSNTSSRTVVHGHLTNWTAWGTQTTPPASQNSAPHSKRCDGMALPNTMTPWLLPQPCVRLVRPQQRHPSSAHWGSAHLSSTNSHEHNTVCANPGCSLEASDFLKHTLHNTVCILIYPLGWDDNCQEWAITA